MTIGIHQPNFLPWIGYFYKISKSDRFVILDDVLYSKGSFINRVMIKTPQGQSWLTVPVEKEDIMHKEIRYVMIHSRTDTMVRLCKTLRANYSGSHFFDMYFEPLQNQLMTSTESLSDLNCGLIVWVCQTLGIKTPLFKSSELNLEKPTTPTGRLIDICRSLDGENYLSGQGGFDYQDLKQFKFADIQVVKSGFVHPSYKQRWGHFIPGLSILDLLFNCGPDALGIIKSSE